MIALESRTCKKCGVNKPLEDFHRHPTCVGGRLHSCKPCQISAGVERARNSQKDKARKSAWHKSRWASCPDYVERSKENGRRYFAREDVKEKMRLRMQKRRELNSEALNARRRELMAEKRSDPRYRVDSRVRAGLRASLKRVGADKGSARTYGILDFSCAELMAHLERQFLPGMSWANMGDWHIDHIRPLSSFDYDSPDSQQFKAAWSLPNLRPLWATDNLKKQASRKFLL